MDDLSGYNQIRTHDEDTSNVYIITDFRVYCYLVMTFGLKNNKVDNIKHHYETFNVMRNHKMMLNLNKCALRVDSKKFL